VEQPVEIRCPTCGKVVPVLAPARPESFPFCQPRCRLRDLGAWLDGRHVIAGRSGTISEDDGSR